MKEIIFKLVMLSIFGVFAAYFLIVEISYIQATNETKYWNPISANIINSFVKEIPRSKGSPQHCVIIYIKTISQSGHALFSFLETQNNCVDAESQIKSYPISKNIEVLVNPKNEASLRSIDFSKRRFDYWDIIGFMIFLAFFIWLAKTDAWELYHKQKRDRMFR